MPAIKETETFQHYQVLRRPDGSLFELGRGAMGVTYKAFDTNLRCDVALKVINALHLDSETARSRFLREARAAAGLRHRNVASVYHLGNDDQCFFYAMEWVDGVTVESLVKENGGGIAVADALQIAAQVARALTAASRQELIHRDIKPANLMVAREEDDDDQFLVKVIDFGLARSAVNSEGSANITMGGFVGTPQFASPEQLEEKDLDVRSDIYSLGVTLWFMLAGKPPFVGALGSVFIQQITKEPPWEQIAHLPESVRALLAHILRKNPDERPQTAVALRREIEATLKLLPPELSRASPLNPPPVTGSPGSAIVYSNTLSSSTPAATDHTGTSAFTPRLGARIGGRYELSALAGEGTNGRVYRARDTVGGSAVAVKVFHSGVLALAAERRRLQETMDKLRQVPHPCLKKVYALGETDEILFLVEEWVDGFSLVNVLRNRGQLNVDETLRLLAQIASATDHARAHELNRLELSLHQISAGFSLSGADSDAPVHATLAGSNIERWPAFSLKFDALGIARETGDSVTWTGDMTLLPQTPFLGRDTQTSIRGLVESSYLFSLGAFVYELLSGAPLAHLRSSDGVGGRYVALPKLNEAANGVLRQVLSPNPSFASGVEFFHALCASCNVVLPASVMPIIALNEVEAAPDSEVLAETMLIDADIGAREMVARGETLSGHETVREVEDSAVEERTLAERQAEAERLALAELRAEEDARAAEEARMAEEERAEAERQALENARVAEDLRVREEARAAEEALIVEAREREEARLAAERKALEEAHLAEERRLAEEARVVQARAAEEARAAERQRAAEKVRLAAEKRAAEEARIAAEKCAAEQARLAAEKRAAEEARIAAEKQAAEQARLAAEKRAAEEARIAAEKRAAEQARLAAEKRAAEEARIAAEKRAAEQARLAAEKRAAEEARIVAEKRAAEKARIAAEKRAAEEAQAAAKKREAEQARVAAELRAAEKARLAGEKRAAEEARLAAKKQAAEQARVSAEKRAAEEKALAAARGLRSNPSLAKLSQTDADIDGEQALGARPIFIGLPDQRPLRQKVLIGAGAGVLLGGGILAISLLFPPQPLATSVATAHGTPLTRSANVAPAPSPEAAPAITNSTPETAPAPTAAPAASAGDAVTNPAVAASTPPALPDQMPPAETASTPAAAAAIPPLASNESTPAPGSDIQPAMASTPSSNAAKDGSEDRDHATDSGRTASRETRDSSHKTTAATREKQGRPGAAPAAARTDNANTARKDLKLDPKLVAKTAQKKPTPKPVSAQTTPPQERGAGIGFMQ